MTNSINRRAMLKGATLLPVMALPTVAIAAPVITMGLPPQLAAIPASQDPLYMALGNYSCGMNLFELIKEADWHKLGGEDAVIEGTYGAPLKVLENWDQPAASLEGAIEALRFVAKECDMFFSSPTVLPMVLAVLQFLEVGRA